MKGDLSFKQLQEDLDNIPPEELRQIVTALACSITDRPELWRAFNDALRRLRTYHPETFDPGTRLLTIAGLKALERYKAQ